MHFFSLDGIDGVGKSTQLALFADWLRGRGLEVATCRDPGSTAVGEAVREILLDVRSTISRRAEMLLYMAARAQLVEEVIQPALNAGKTVLTDRFLLSNVVYQGHAGRLPVEELWRIGRLATAGLEPSLTFILDMPPEEADQRLSRQRDRMELQGEEFRNRLRQGFLDEAARQPDRITVINASGDVETVQERIRSAAENVLD